MAARYLFEMRLTAAAAAAALDLPSAVVLRLGLVRFLSTTAAARLMTAAAALDLLSVMVRRRATVLRLLVVMVAGWAAVSMVRRWCRWQRRVRCLGC